MPEFMGTPGPLTATHFEVFDATGHQIAEFCSSSFEEDCANARAFAAVPEMIAELQKVRDYLDAVRPPAATAQIARIDAALAKALGEDGE